LPQRGTKSTKGTRQKRQDRKSKKEKGDGWLLRAFFYTGFFSPTFIAFFVPLVSFVPLVATSS
jgi:hypothetical protein